MATVKHIKIQNSNYGVATEYLTMQHNKFTNKPIYGENCLTPERAQELGMELARKAFPDHQVLVCTQKDGHNSADNIHCHIVLNSVRKLDVPREDFILLRADNIAGMKHHSSRGFKEFFRQSVMDICQREGLYQVDHLSDTRQDYGSRILGTAPWSGKTRSGERSKSSGT